MEGLSELVNLDQDTEQEKKPEELRKNLRTILTGILNHATSNSQREEVLKMFDENGMDRPVPIMEMQRQSLELQAKLYNESEGFMHLKDGIDCPICKNKGFIEFVTYNETFDYYSSTLKECECSKQRKSWRRIQASGLGYALQYMTFDTFLTDQDWQAYMKSKALDFVKGKGGAWFYIGGQVGCGKSHICTAMCGDFLKQNHTVKYMKWAEESVRLKGKVNDEDYAEALNEYKKPDILYIDDFFKCQRTNQGIQKPSPADVRLAYQIIDYRYCNKMPTIISSEWTIEEIMDFDEATSSRIYQMSKGSTIIIDRKKERNFRRFGMEMAI